MNFINNACLSRCGCEIWSTHCSCRDTLNVANLSSTNTKQSKLIISGIKSSLQRKSCYKNLALLSRPALWTQVRFAKSPLRFHRDLEYPDFDEYRKNQFADVRRTSWGQGDEKPGMTYTVALAGGMAGMYAAKSVCTYLITYMSAAADVLALASVEVDLTNIAPGACNIVKWRGKPLMIKHRTPAEIDVEKPTVLGSLRDPESEEKRTQKPQWLVIIGICTHLGCVPMANSGDHVGGFYCPCHGSHYDNLGRIRKGPAPTNMVVPPYKFTGDNQILVG